MKKLITILFIYSGFTFAQDCNIQSKTDKYTGEITSASGLDWCRFYKYIKGVDTSYYLSLWAEGTFSNYNAHGIIILFTDGTKIEKPNVEVDCKYRAGVVYDYRAWIKLDDDEIEMLSKKIMTGFQVYSPSREFGEKKALKIQTALICLLK